MSQLTPFVIFLFVVLCSHVMTALTDNSDDYGETNEIEEIYSHNVSIPKFVSKSGNVFVKAGDRLKLNCQVDDDIDPHILMWHHGDKLIFVDKTKLSPDSRLILRQLDKNSGSSITVNDFDPIKDSGKYRCTISTKPEKSLEFIVSEATNDTLNDVIEEPSYANKDTNSGSMLVSFPSLAVSLILMLRNC